MHASQSTSPKCAEELRSIRDLSKPDVRMRAFVVNDGTAWRAMTQDDRHRSISRYALLPSVPDEICVQFDVARNLFMYAWHVYRFHAVSEQHVLSTLEMALRENLIARGHLDSQGMLNAPLPQQPGKKKAKRVMLRMLISHAAAYNLISNDRLVNRTRWAEHSADIARSIALSQLIERQGLTELKIPSETAEPTAAELNFDWIGAFVESLPSIRNAYAHGGSQIHAAVLRTFDIVSDLINQLYADRQQPSDQLQRK
jgi:hypothetical protein